MAPIVKNILITICEKRPVLKTLPVMIDSLARQRLTRLSDSAHRFLAAISIIIVRPFPFHSFAESDHGALCRRGMEGNRLMVPEAPLMWHFGMLFLATAVDWKPVLSDM